MRPQDGTGKQAGSPKDPQLIPLHQKPDKIYTRSFEGFYRNLRIAGGALLFILYFGVLWLEWEGRQAVLFDLPARKFHVFGITFWPQDFMMLSWTLIICAFGLFFITVLAGRVWCGYTCPQSVFTWVYMWAERVTEGDRNKRMKRDKGPMSVEKLWRKAAKHSLWFGVALATGITFVGYFTPVKELIPALLSFDAGSWALFWIGFFTVATYLNAGWLRENVCMHMCPYARFQSVMFDSETLTIWYDEKRGENRGPRKRGMDYKEKGLGDCIDCKACVHVCPTGIDIREGLQYECIGCAACVDACDTIMEKMGYDKGLVRYTSANELDGKKTHLLRPRMIGYFTALVIMISTLIWNLDHRVPYELGVQRDRNSLFTENRFGQIENVYQLKLINKDQQSHDFTVSVSGFPGLVYNGPTKVSVSTGGVETVPVRIAIDPSKLKDSGSINLTFTISPELDADDGYPDISINSSFIAPQ
ncbi:cytochrome c oxidase accessory protein CcoG [Endozoicomonadaceae bacterium StTr2]